jgi:hypothetical protein
LYRGAGGRGAIRYKIPPGARRSVRMRACASGRAGVRARARALISTGDLPKNYEYAKARREERATELCIASGGGGAGPGYKTVSRRYN